jgi:hypothetical protein
LVRHGAERTVQSLARSEQHTALTETTPLYERQSKGGQTAESMVQIKTPCDEVDKSKLRRRRRRGNQQTAGRGGCELEVYVIDMRIGFPTTAAMPPGRVCLLQSFPSSQLNVDVDQRVANPGLRSEDAVVKMLA